MTRKHFKALAEAFAAVSPKGAEWRLCVERIASACRQFNPAFDRYKFLHACGYYDEPNEGGDWNEDRDAKTIQDFC